MECPNCEQHPTLFPTGKHIYTPCYLRRYKPEVRIRPSIRTSQYPMDRPYSTRSHFPLGMLLPSPSPLTIVIIKLVLVTLSKGVQQNTTPGHVGPFETGYLLGDHSRLEAVGVTRDFYLSICQRDGVLFT